MTQKVSRDEAWRMVNRLSNKIEEPEESISPSQLLYIISQVMTSDKIDKRGALKFAHKLVEEIVEHDQHVQEILAVTGCLLGLLADCLKITREADPNGTSLAAKKPPKEEE